MRRLRPHLSYANVVSTLCLVLLLGGGAAFAASKALPTNSVGTRQLKSEAVTAAKIRAGAVTGAKIDLSTLGTVPSATLAASATRAITAESAVAAQTLEGMSAEQVAAKARLRCPNVMSLDHGICFGAESEASLPQFEAIFRCNELGYRLPLAGELLAFEADNYNTLPPEEWTEPETSSGSGIYGMLATAASHAAALNPANSNTSHPYRCVTPATN
ncbi:MAG TPA: hypothetical protein VF731_01335 [Solirubrobacterales bacterium]